MDFDLERRFFVERMMDFVEAMEEESSDLHLADDNRVLFRVQGRPFETLVWVSEDSEMICITTRTADLPIDDFDAAVQFLKQALETCWDHCVAVASVEARYDLSMAIFTGGVTFDSFEAALYNLLSCAEVIEQNYKDRRK